MSGVYFRSRVFFFFFFFPRPALNLVATTDGQVLQFLKHPQTMEVSWSYDMSHVRCMLLLIPQIVRDPCADYILGPFQRTDSEDGCAKQHLGGLAFRLWGLRFRDRLG